MSLYDARRRRNAIAMGLSVAATGFGLGWLILILGALVWDGLGGLSARVCTETTPPPGSTGGLLNAIVGLNPAARSAISFNGSDIGGEPPYSIVRRGLTMHARSDDA